MKKEEFKKLQPEIQEYIQFMLEIGMINSNNKDKILDKLSRTEIIYDNKITAGGVTQTGKNNSIEVKINKAYIKKEAEEMNIDFDELLDINIFHELTHASSILDVELEDKTRLLFSNIDKSNNDYPFIFQTGYTLISEFIAQSISQKIVEKKYENHNLYPIKHGKFTYTENSYLVDQPAYSYEYDSNLVYYGELENIALKFIQTIYGDIDIEKLYEDHFEEKIFDVLSTNFKNRKNGIENLYDMFGCMSNIIVGDCYQQGYYGPEKRNWVNINRFKNSINEFNRIADNEIEKQQMQL